MRDVRFGTLVIKLIQYLMVSLMSDHMVDVLDDRTGRS